MGRGWFGVHVGDGRDEVLVAEVGIMGVVAFGIFKYCSKKQERITWARVAW